MTCTFYLPKEYSGKLPVVIGMPGLLHHTEKGRCDTILEKLSMEKIAGIRLNYSSITRANYLIKCEFDIDNCINDLEDVFRIVNNSKFLDSKNIGILASSISAAVFGYYIAKKGSIGINAYVQISPLSGWNTFVNQKTRERIISSKEDLRIDLVNQSKNGIRRTIPFKNIESLHKMDAIKFLKNSIPQNLEVLTLIGKEDVISEPSSMKEYHFLLGGKSENINEYECGHDIPLEHSEKQIIEFLRKRLIEKNA